MTLDTIGPGDASLTSAGLALAQPPATRPVRLSYFRRAANTAGDALGLMALILAIPLVILAIGAPIVLCIRILLWAVGLL